MEDGWAYQDGGASPVGSGGARVHGPVDGHGVGAEEEDSDGEEDLKPSGIGGSDREVDSDTSEDDADAGADDDEDEIAVLERVTQFPTSNQFPSRDFQPCPLRGPYIAGDAREVEQMNLMEWEERGRVEDESDGWVVRLRGTPSDVGISTPTSHQISFCEAISDSVKDLSMPAGRDTGACVRARTGREYKPTRMSLAHEEQAEVELSCVRRKQGQPEMEDQKESDHENEHDET
ncbi:hypothetical protein BJ138DRAFT_1106261 [Hygrophoropsis aurantiaca]|uniref:Uncharacterized protein n=1 Tax=Hygrophoropsis aurantiaca TaxID=72124 RepID=A0ACB7ZWI6_9AGAM|nr:hypothetical protein BJ138DRAFT_1106261 [Hygrophoropsis aurantiaca]